jgi:hypothetical protein
MISMSHWGREDTGSGHRVYLTGYAVTTVQGALLVAAHDRRQADQ